MKRKWCNNNLVVISGGVVNLSFLSNILWNEEKKRYIWEMNGNNTLTSGWKSVYKVLQLINASEEEIEEMRKLSQESENSNG